MSDLPAPPGPGQVPAPPVAGWPGAPGAWGGAVATVPVPEGPTELAPAVVTMWRLQGLGYALGTTVVALVAAGVVGVPAGVVLLIGSGVLAVGLALALWLPAVAHRRWRYALTDEALELAHGVVVRTESTIPHFRVQHVDVHQGPLERWLGIARLQIATASSATDAEVPGVEVARAEPIRRHVLARSQSGDAV